jgi:hypothetical protein
MNLTHDKEFQRQLLNHPAYRHQGVDPLWRIIAITGWATVLALMVALSARSQDLVVGLNSKRASSPASAGGHMKLLLWSNDNQKISHGLSMLGMAWHGRAWRGGAGQVNARHQREPRAETVAQIYRGAAGRGRARQGQARQGGARQGMARQGNNETRGRLTA